jgi:aryl-alcohol dehydrogenase-like predicted oxidoreductase
VQGINLGFHTVDDTRIMSNHGGNNKKALRQSVEASLGRLRTAYIDTAGSAQPRLKGS